MSLCRSLALLSKSQGFYAALDLELLQRASTVLGRQRARTELAGGPIFLNPTTAKPWADEQVQRRYFDAAIKRLGYRHRAPKQTRGIHSRRSA